jgi:hypothetical protein
MTTAFKLIQDAVTAVLSAPPMLVAGPIRAGFDGTTAVDQSTKQVEVKIVKAKGVYALAGIGAPRQWETILMVTFKVRSSPGDLMDEPLDEMLGLGEDRLAQLTPASIGALSIDLDPELAWGVEAGSPPWALVQRRMRITHETLGPGLAPRA